MSKSWIKDIPHYFNRYMNLVPEDDYTDGLINSYQECYKLLSALSEEQANYAYEPGKWTIKEVLQHVSDSERIFMYRSLSISRGETRKLIGFDQDQYTAGSNANSRNMSVILDDFKAVRDCSISLFNTLDEEQMKKQGSASGFNAQPIFYAYLISGHLRHHLNVIRDRYLD